ncbi:nucleotide pyrophosphohydrolase [Candidatus Nanopelagicales bacterium]|nr:nucleotide pyrophosphohydrolase [Candidatus Nanopelagicales bacterium]
MARSCAVVTLKELEARLVAFAQARDWGQFHSPKNLAISVAIEAGELLEHFQWVTEDQSREFQSSPEKVKEIQGEVADVLGYLLLLSHQLQFDPTEALATKVAANEDRYPIEKARGNAKKYTTWAGESADD